MPLPIAEVMNVKVDTIQKHALLDSFTFISDQHLNLLVEYSSLLISLYSTLYQAVTPHDCDPIWGSYYMSSIMPQ